MMTRESLLKELDYGAAFKEYELREVIISHCSHTINNRSTFIPFNGEHKKEMYVCTECGKLIDLTENNISKESIKMSCNMISSVLSLVKILKIESGLFLRFQGLSCYNKDIEELNAISLIQHSVRNNVMPLYYYVLKNIPMIRFSFTKDELLTACDIIDNVFDIVKFSLYNMMNNSTKSQINDNFSFNGNYLYSTTESDLLKTNILLNEYNNIIFNSISV